MITGEELDRLIESQHDFFPERTLEQIACVYAQSAEAARSAGKHEAATWYNSVATALYARLNRDSNGLTVTTLQFSSGDKVEVLDRNGKVFGRGIVTRIVASGLVFLIEFEDTGPGTNSRTIPVPAKDCRKVGEH